MSPERRWRLEELSELIEAFDNPMAVSRGDLLLRVNEAYLRARGWAREEVEGKPWRELISAEHRLRMEDVTMEMRPEEGRVVREQAHLQRLKAADGGQELVLANLIPLGEQPLEMEQFGLLAEIALSLSAARSEQAVREAVVRGFTRAGIPAGFFWNGTEPSPSEVKPEARYMVEAIARNRPVFAGLGPNPDAVYLPLDPTSRGAEVLFVAGGPILAEHLPVWGLFARQVTSALGTARLIDDLERGRDELSTMAELARMAGQPASVLSDLLARVAEGVGADAVLLHAGGEEGQHPLESAHGLSEGERAIFEARPLWMSVSEQAPDERLSEATLGRFVAGASVQLRQGQSSLGVLTVLRRAPLTFDAGALRLLDTLGDLLRTFLEQQRLREASERKLEESRHLLELARVAAGTLELDELLKAACDALSRLLDMPLCHISLCEDDPPRLVGGATNGPLAKIFPHMVVQLDQPGITLRAARERRMVVVRDGVRELSALAPEFVESQGPRACVAIPLVSREELVGVVSLTSELPVRDFTPEWLDFANAAVGQIALAIVNARIHASLEKSFGELDETRRDMVKQERLAALGELSAVVAHEVRNPLGVIFNAVSSLRRLIAPRGDAEVLLDILGEESDRLNRMVAELLDFARPSALSFQPEDLSTVIHESLLYANASQRPSDVVRFEVDVDPELPPLRMDRRMFRQALENVAVNAMQAMPKGGALKVRAHLVRRAGRPFARVEMRDGGPGIPEAVAKRIFEPFFTTKAQGTGLGLAVVRRIVEDHQGEVEVSSMAGVGTTFTFHFPFEPGALQ